LFAEKFQALTHRRPLILGHRGSPRLARENSLASFNLALEEGADGIELDVHVTADGVLVAHHDEFLATREIIAQTSFADLLRAQKAVGSDLPTLAEVFHLVAGRGVLNIELKNPGYEAAAMALARAHLPVDTFAFSSFDPRAVLSCRQHAPDVPAFWIVFGPRHSPDDVKILEGIDASGIALENRFVTAEMAALYRERQLPVFVWTVNDPAEAAHFAKLGVTGLITDVPRELLTTFA
jgi:glycerophosphoryl diester phosphodiesterase